MITLEKSFFRSKEVVVLREEGQATIICSTSEELSDALSCRGFLIRLPTSPGDLYRVGERITRTKEVGHLMVEQTTVEITETVIDKRRFYKTSKS